MSLVVSDFKLFRQKVIRDATGGVDLDSSEQCNLAIASHFLASIEDNLEHEFALHIVEGVGEFHRGLFGPGEAFGVGEEHGADKVLLGIECSFGHGGLGTSPSDLADVAGGSGGTAAAGPGVYATTTVNLANVAVGIDTDVGAKDNEARTVLRNVVGHGAKARHAAKGKTGQTTHGKVVAVRVDKGLFEVTVDFVAAKRRCQKTRTTVAVFLQRQSHASDNVLVPQSTRKTLVHFLELCVSSGCLLKVVV